jgi:hypothetical protein
MGWTETNPVAIGAPTKKADFDALWDNVSFVQQVRAESGAMQTNAGTIPYDDTIPQNTEGYEYMTLAITPKNAANILLVEAVFHLSPAGNDHITVALFQDSGANAIAAAVAAVTSGWIQPITLKHYMVAGGVAAITFKIRAGAIAAAVTLNGAGGGRKLGGVLMSSITITEMKP